MQAFNAPPPERPKRRRRRRQNSPDPLPLPSPPPPPIPRSAPLTTLPPPSDPNLAPTVDPGSVDPDEAGSAGDSALDENVSGDTVQESQVVAGDLRRAGSSDGGLPLSGSPSTVTTATGQPDASEMNDGDPPLPRPPGNITKRQGEDEEEAEGVEDDEEEDEEEEDSLEEERRFYTRLDLRCEDLAVVSLLWLLSFHHFLPGCVSVGA